MRSRYVIALFCVCLTVLMLFSDVAAQPPNATLEITQDTLNRLISRLGKLSASKDFYYSRSVAIPGTEICHPVGFMECPGLSGMMFEMPGGGSIPGGREIPGAPGIPGFGGWDRIPVMVCEEEGGTNGIIPYGDPIHYQWWVTEAYFTLGSGSMSFTATIRTLVEGAGRNVTTRTVPATVDFDAPTNRIWIKISEFIVPLVYAGETFENVDVGRLYSIAIPVVPQDISVPMPDGETKTVTAKVVGITPRYLMGTVMVEIDVGF